MKKMRLSTKNKKKFNFPFFYLINVCNFAFLLLYSFNYFEIFGKEKTFSDLEINHKTTSKDNPEISKFNWYEYNLYKNKKIIWRRYKGEFEDYKFAKKEFDNSIISSINSLNRSLVFNDQWIGPDISWIVPSGLGWNKKYKFDFTARGHNTQIPDPKTKKFFKWNDGDAVGLISYQFLHREKSSFGINFGVRSLYQGDQASGGASAIGEGLSGGFRWDYRLSKDSGLAFGAEQLVHFDSVTDTGRNIYLTASKAWWSSKYNDVGFFPLYVATAGVGTGRMAVGNIKGLCSNSLGGDGTEIYSQRSLCWSPVFSLARVWNEKFSTYFEYNSRFFLLGSSYAPLKKVPIRGNFALILSDHIDNYKLHNGSEMNWVFNLSLGF